MQQRLKTQLGGYRPNCKEFIMIMFRKRVRLKLTLSKLCEL